MSIGSVGVANLRTTISGAFGRSSSAISIVVVVAFTVMILSTAYHMLAFDPAAFAGDPDVQDYENALENVSEMDEWTRTQYYWSNNLRVAGICVIATPTYFGFNSMVATNYMIGMSLTYFYHVLGPSGVSTFSSQIFVHGLLELTGFYIITAVTLRVAWNLWKGMGRLVALTGKDKRGSAWKLTKREKREISKHKGTIKLLLSDFITLFAIGAFFIFLAAPIEAYVSPVAGLGFFREPVLTVIFLISIGFLYASIVAWGFNAMRRDLKYVWNETKLVFRGKLRPTQLSLLIFVIFSAIVLFRILL